VTGAGFFDTPLGAFRGVGPKREQALAHAGLATVGDLLSRLPFRYEDRTTFRDVASVQEGERVTLVGELINCRLRWTGKRGFKVFEAALRDASGCLLAVWPNQPYRQNTLRAHQSVVLHGLVTRYRGVLQVSSPEVEVVETDRTESIHAGRIVPVYEKTGPMTGRMQRALVHAVLERLPDDVEDLLPGALRARLGLPGRRQALRDAHFPPTGTPAGPLGAFRTPAQLRLIVEECFLFQCGVIERRRQEDCERKPFVPVADDRVRAAARAVLPFRLTPGQRAALKDIVDDMRSPRQMNRLLQGDVGSGKTAVGVLAALVALENGLQVAVMAPTEILAEQHAETMVRWLAPTRFSVGLLTGSIGAAKRRELLDGLGAGRLHVVVGTHALIEEAVRFHRLGLAIVDEQHRFGVVQRARLRAKGLRPDVLVMTATPIPRTLQLTAYGGLDVSVIRDLPPGRLPIRTTVRPQARREEVYAFVREAVAAGRQACIVYPLVDESDKVDLRAATAMADHLAQDVFPQYRVGLIHGRMAPASKDEVMRRFAAGEVDVLVATTVIEVGIDVPNATVMVVEHAERFGLSQLHQLRGRVGRGAHQASCVLLYQEPLSADAEARLKTMAETSDGFVIAERDLELRGAGDVAGTRQAGLPTLRVGNLSRDRDVMELAAAEARAWMEEDGADVERVRAFVRDRWAGQFGLMSVG
jgi:ATP-dependent DNA helicase RecG